MLLRELHADRETNDLEKLLVSLFFNRTNSTNFPESAVEKEKSSLVSPLWAPILALPAVSKH